MNLRLGIGRATCIVGLLLLGGGSGWLGCGTTGKKSATGGADGAASGGGGAGGSPGGRGGSTGGSAQGGSSGGATAGQGGSVGGQAGGAGTGGIAGSAGSQGGVSGGASGAAGSAGGPGGMAGAGNAGGAGGSLSCGASHGDDPFAGTWVGTQGNEVWTVMNSGSCSEWTGRINGTVCDSCVGQYTHDGTTTLSCMPSHGCGSPVHQDTGKLTRTDCSLSYGYDFGSGSTAWTGQWTSDLTTIVCS